MAAAVGCRTTPVQPKGAGSGRKTTGPERTAGLPKEWMMSTTELAFVNLLLGVLSLCVIGITILLYKGTRRLDILLSQGEKAVSEAQRTLATVRQLLARTDRVAGDLEKVVRRSCRVAGSVLNQVEAAQEKAQTFWNRSFGNGHVAKVRVRNRG